MSFKITHNDDLLRQFNNLYEIAPAEPSRGIGYQLGQFGTGLVQSAAGTVGGLGGFAKLLGMDTVGNALNSVETSANNWAGSTGYDKPFEFSDLLTGDYWSKQGARDLGSMTGSVLSFLAPTMAGAKLASGLGKVGRFAGAVAFPTALESGVEGGSTYNALEGNDPDATSKSWQVIGENLALLGAGNALTLGLNAKIIGNKGITELMSAFAPTGNKVLSHPWVKKGAELTGTALNEGLQEYAQEGFSAGAEGRPFVWSANPSEWTPEGKYAATMGAMMGAGVSGVSSLLGRKQAPPPDMSEEEIVKVLSDVSGGNLLTSSQPNLLLTGRMDSTELSTELNPNWEFWTGRNGEPIYKDVSTTVNPNWQFVGNSEQPYIDIETVPEQPPMPQLTNGYADRNAYASEHLLSPIEKYFMGVDVPTKSRLPGEGIVLGQQTQPGNIILPNETKPSRLILPEQPSIQQPVKEEKPGFTRTAEDRINERSIKLAAEKLQSAVKVRDYAQAAKMADRLGNKKLAEFLRVAETQKTNRMTKLGGKLTEELQAAEIEKGKQIEQVVKAVLGRMPGVGRKAQKEQPKETTFSYAPTHAEIKPGDTVFHPTNGAPLKVVDTRDPAELKVDSGKSQFSIGRKAVLLQKPEVTPSGVQASGETRTVQPATQKPETAETKQVPVEEKRQVEPWDYLDSTHPDAMYLTWDSNNNTGKVIGGKNLSPEQKLEWHKREVARINELIKSERSRVTNDKGIKWANDTFTKEKNRNVRKLIAQRKFHEEALAQKPPAPNQALNKALETIDQYPDLTAKRKEDSIPHGYMRMGERIRTTVGEMRKEIEEQKAFIEKVRTAKWDKDNPGYSKGETKRGTINSAESNIADLEKEIQKAIAEHNAFREKFRREEQQPPAEAKTEAQAEDSRSPQEKFLDRKGLTMEQARKLPREEQDKINEEYSSWYKTQTGKTPEDEFIYNRMKKMIDEKDYKGLRDTLLSNDNKRSRKFFEEITGNKLPEQQGKRLEALSQLYPEEHKAMLDARKKKEEEEKANQPPKKSLQEARADAVLEVKRDYGKHGGVMTRREFINKIIDAGGVAEARETVDNNALDKAKERLRVMAQSYPLGNPNHPRTKEYNELKKKIEEKDFKKTEYRLRQSPSDNSFWEITKTEHDYAQKYTESKKKKEVPREEPQTAPQNGFEKTKEITKKIKSGEYTAQDVKDSHKFLVENKDNIIQTTLAFMNTADNWKRKHADTKQKAAEDYYKDMLQRVAMTTDDAFSWSPFTETYEQAVKRIVDGVTDEKIKTYQDKLAAKRAQLKKSIENPETLAEFHEKIAHKGADSLTPEERAKFDELKALQDKERNQTKVVYSGADIPDYTVEKSKHTKTGEDIWIVKLAERLDTEAYKALNAKIKALGGYYSNYVKGFVFKDDPTAKLSDLKENKAVRISTAPTEDRKKEVADKLRAVADNMQETIDDKLAPRLANTARRARMAASVESDGHNLTRIQKILRNIADAIESGKAVHLDGVSARTHIETLEHYLYLAKLASGKRTGEHWEKTRQRSATEEDISRVEYPNPTANIERLKELFKWAEGKKGLVQARKRLAGLIKKTDPKEYVVNISSVYDDVLKINAEAKNKGISEGLEDYKRLGAMGIKTSEQLRSALREFLTIQNGAKMTKEEEKQQQLREMERNLGLYRTEGYFPTPANIVEEMIDKADIQKGMSVLEPSAGKGNIADKVPDDADLEVVEIDTKLSEYLTAKGHNVVGSDFLKHKGEYDRIVMNPPFENGQDIDHVRHAYDLLKPGGRIVAIMGEGAFSRSDKKATAFRAWLDGLGALETSKKLPDAFRNAERSTGVNTRMVVIDKPVEKKEVYTREERQEVIKQSKAAGNKHLDALPHGVEALRGRRIQSIFDNSLGTITSANSDGTINVTWDDEESAKHNFGSLHTVSLGNKTYQQWSSSVIKDDKAEFIVLPETREVTKGIVLPLNKKEVTTFNIDRFRELSFKGDKSLEELQELKSMYEQLKEIYMSSKPFPPEVFDIVPNYKHGNIPISLDVAIDRKQREEREKQQYAKYKINARYGSSQNITAGHIQAAFPSAKITRKENSFIVELPNGKSVRISLNERILIDYSNANAAYGFDVSGWEASGMFSLGNVAVDGVPLHAFISLSKDADINTVNHEAFHAAFSLALSEREQRALLSKYGSEEKAAAAYEKWNPSQPNTVFGKILQWVKKLLSSLSPRADVLFDRIKSGEIYNQKGTAPSAGAKYQLKPERIRMKKEVADKYAKEINELLKKGWVKVPVTRTMPNGKVVPVNDIVILEKPPQQQQGAKSVFSNHMKGLGKLFEKIGITPGGNVSLHTKEDYSKPVTGISVQSPTKLAAKHEILRPVVNAGVQSTEVQEQLRNKYQKELNNIFNLKDKKVLFDILIEGDEVRKEFTDAELKQKGADSATIEAYHKLRALTNGMYDMLDEIYQQKHDGEHMPKIEGYVPHFFHEWKVLDGKKILATFKTQREALKYANGLDNAKKYSVEPWMQSFGSFEYGAVVSDDEYIKVRRRIAKILGKHFDPGLITDDTLKTGNKHRFLGNLRQRKGIEGWDKDVEEAFRKYFNISSRYVAMEPFKFYSQTYFEQNFGAWDKEYKGIAGYMKDYINDLNGVPTDVEVALNNLINNMPLFGKFVGSIYGDRPALQMQQGITGTIAVTHLGLFNVASAAVQLSQLAFVNAKLGTKATMYGMQHSANLTAADKAILEKVGIDHQLSLDDNGYSKSKVKNFLSKSMYLFRAADNYTRRVSALGGYYKAIAEGKTPAEAEKYAKEITYETNFNYSEADAPGILRRYGAVSKILFQFKKYPIKTLEFIAGMNKSEHMRFWTGVLLLSGLMGFPGSEWMLSLFSGVMKMFGVHVDPQTFFKRKAMEWAGKDGAKQAIVKTALYGLFSNVGIDVSKRVGLGDIVPNKPSDVLGVAAGTAGRLITVMQQANDLTAPVIAELAGAIAPVTRQLYKAGEGESVDPRERLKYQYSAMERLALATGFNPIGETVDRDKGWIVRNYENSRQREQQTAIDKYLNNRSPENLKKLREAGVTTEQVRNAMQNRGKTPLQRVQDSLPKKAKPQYSRLKEFS